MRGVQRLLFMAQQEAEQRKAHWERLALQWVARYRLRLRRAGKWRLAVVSPGHGDLLPIRELQCALPDGSSRCAMGAVAGMAPWQVNPMILARAFDLEPEAAWCLAEANDGMRGRVRDALLRAVLPLSRIPADEREKRRP